MPRTGRTRPLVGIDTFSLGPLELEVLDVIWDRTEPGTVMDIYIPILDARRERGELISPATVMTVMNRLAKKGILDRRKQKGTSVYAPLIGRAEMAQRMVEGIVDKVLRGDPSPVIDYLSSRSK
ncbi:MAG: BlaI/MecI/CopY family transcriptional regulator [Armatimonadota bacterium]